MPVTEVRDPVRKPYSGEYLRIGEQAMNTKRNLKMTVAAVAIAMTAVAGSATTWAAPGEIPSVRVPYGDLDLTREEGLAKLHSRVRTAAEQVCRDFDRLDPEERQTWRECYETAVSKAVAQIDDIRVAPPG